ncbi:PREDICTED: opticin [Mesitornis unicolor]|uniref:opticin n=1 Tax=Mesitornis unicolor TaxID=54374 RepID=UPI000528D343|nr:PREDICTED: opticin [Mesitornis unicolor]
MRTLAWLGIASLCLGTAWAVPAKEERRKAEKPKADFALYENLDLDNYDLTLDNYGEILDLSNYEELYEYNDFAPKIEVGTLAPRPKDPAPLPDLGTAAETPKPQPPTAAGPIHPAPIPAQGPPSCLLCLCIGTSVYCDDADLEHIPLLPPETTYLYARFNRIGAIQAGDFMGLKKLKRIDLTSNFISRADADAFRLLPSLQELILPENRLTALPELPRSIVRLDARLGMVQRAGVGFISPLFPQDLKQLQFLHLSDNQLDYIPAPLPQSLRSLHLQNNNIQTMQEDTFCDSHDHSQVRRALEDIRLDGNPINLSLFPNAYFCLPRLPTGRFF